MITPKALSEARVLIVGSGNLVDELVRGFASHGVSNLTVMDTTTFADDKLCTFVNEDPEALITKDSNYFKSFDLVLAANQPRAFELSLSDLRWPKNETETDLPMMVMRSVGNNCKMRCQYCELPVTGGVVSKFINLLTDLLPWTDEKRGLVASTVRSKFNPDKDLTFQSYLIAAEAFIKFQHSKGSWPGPQEKEQVQASIGHSGKGSDTEIQTYLTTFLEGGLAAAPETIALLAHLIVSDAVKLLSGNGQPINNTNVDEVIKIVAKSL